MARDRVALGTQRVGHFARIPARLRESLVAELRLIVAADAVAERALIPGHGDDRTRTAVGKVGVLVEEIIEQRHEVIAAVARLAVGVHVLARELAIFHQQAGGKAVAALVGSAVAVAVGHVFVVAHVVLRHNDGCFSGGEIDVARNVFRRAVGLLLRPGDVVDVHKHVAPLVQALQHGVELFDRGHELVVAALLGVAVKGAGGVGDERVEKDVRNGRRVSPADGLCLLRLEIGLGLLQLRCVLPPGIARHSGDGLVVVILRGEVLRLREHGVLLRDLCGGRGQRGGVVLGRAVVPAHEHEHQHCCQHDHGQHGRKHQHRLVRAAALRRTAVDRERTGGRALLRRALLAVGPRGAAGIGYLHTRSPPGECLVSEKLLIAASTIRAPARIVQARAKNSELLRNAPGRLSAGGRVQTGSQPRGTVVSRRA